MSSSLSNPSVRPHRSFVTSLALLVLTLLAACSSAPRVAGPTLAPPPAASSSAAAPAPAPAPAPPARPIVGLYSEDFEGGAGSWHLGGKGYDVAVDPTQAHGGKASVRIAFHEAGAFGVMGQGVPAGIARGKQITLAGWIKTDAVDGGYAGLWLRIDGPEKTMLLLDNMQARGVRGTTPWTRYEVVLAVPEDAEGFAFGAILTGHGAAWVDDVSLGVRELPTVHPIAVAGTVRDASGKPVVGALVAVIPTCPSRADATATTGADGRFTVTVPSGRHALTATAPGLAGGYRPMATMDDPVADADVVVGGASSFTVTGKTLVSGAPPPAGTLVSASRVSEVEGDVFYAATDATGAYALALPAAPGYSVGLDAPRVSAGRVDTSGNVDQAIDLAGIALAPAPDAVVDWVKSAAVPIATTDPAHDVSDLEPLGAIVGNARVVALGEATHGTREFFQLKHRLLEYLVARQGFTVFGIEASYPESLAVNEYVLHGTGDPRRALAGLYFWTWDTAEVLDQIEWMRAWNADPKHVKKVKFLGFDMQTAHVGVARVLAYLGKVDPAAAKAATSALGPLDAEHEARYRALPEDQRAATAKAIAGLVDLFDQRKARWIARSSATEWAVARQHAVVVGQAERHMFRVGLDPRDEAMAHDVRWLLDQEPKGTRMVLWAHNAHVNKATPWMKAPMGMHLARELGSDYVALGFVFDRGHFQAMGAATGNGADGALTLGEHSVGEAPVGDVAEALHRAGMPLFALDLRHAPAGVVADWMNAPHGMRELGASFRCEGASSLNSVLPRRFDAVVFVDETTRARPLPALGP